MICWLRTTVPGRTNNGNRKFIELNTSDGELTSDDIRHIIRTLEMIEGWFREYEKAAKAIASASATKVEGET